MAQEVPSDMTQWSNKSPLEWQDYINKEVKVYADEKNDYQGWLVTVDPVSTSIVLANFQEDQETLIRVIMGHAVQEVQVVDEADEATKDRLAHLFTPRETTSPYCKDDLEKKKLSLKNWLEQNNIPVSVQGESCTVLCVAGVLTIDPPYGPENCSSANEIILSRVQGLLQWFLNNQGETRLTSH
ncbi:gem-associated protein 6 isoform X1 [Xenopus laevis]|uniref:Gem-associated protein 6 n=1 Tax=Xenopus laevis TaxID=8355 RepID=A0A8J0VKF7_XENLA|nr:gem-associated protein 6 isoform X1 [Xenopus laevis]